MEENSRSPRGRALTELFSPVELLSRATQSAYSDGVRESVAAETHRSLHSAPIPCRHGPGDGGMGSSLDGNMVLLDGGMDFL